jgi:hypothetical protein
MARGGVCTADRKLADGEEHTLHFKAKTPTEVALFSAAESRWQNTGDEAVKEREKRRAAFIASSLCDESGALLMTEAEAEQIPASLRPELCSMILDGSAQTVGGKNDLRSGAKNGSGTSSP